MPATVTANGLTVVHKGSNGISQAFPDVCKTPAPPAPFIPVPYPNIAMSSDAADTATSVKADGKAIMLSTSKFAMSSGDEAGTLLGIVSNKVKGSANPQMWSMDVKAEGKNVFRQFDIMLQNGGSKPTNTPPTPEVQAPLVGFVTGMDPRRWKIIHVQWSETKKRCGDPVKIKTTTEGYFNGMPMPHLITKAGGNSRNVYGMKVGKVMGNAAEVEWLTRNGLWEKDHKRLKATARGIGGAKESSNALEIEVPDGFKIPVAMSAEDNNYHPLKEDSGVTLTESSMWRLTTKRVGSQPKLVPDTTKTFGWAYSYTLSLNKGKLQIHCKIKLDVQKGVRLSGRSLEQAKKKWKKTIERIWDSKWKEHRVDCLRGDSCNCRGGCCVFPIRVKCSFVDGHADTTVKLWPGAPKMYTPAYDQKREAILRGLQDEDGNPEWWNAYNWYEDLGRAGSGNAVRAHEFGHNIGMYDEYAGASPVAEYYDIVESIMNRGTSIMEQHWQRHPYRDDNSVHRNFCESIEERYKLLKK